VTKYSKLYNTLKRELTENIKKGTIDLKKGTMYFKKGTIDLKKGTKQKK
jgi:hypothetical protein